MITKQIKEQLESASRRIVDLHISALGFEDRCTALVRRGLIESKKSIFLKFPETDLHEYRRNHSILQNVRNSTFIELADQNFLTKLRSAISETSAKHVLVDISSMNRTMIAAVFSSFMNSSKNFEIEVLYVPAQFVEPNPNYSEIEAAGPVLPEFSAFDDASDHPTSIIVGVGYEYGIALGLINRIEPKNTICLYATGHDERFEKAVRKANLDFKFPGISATTLSYDMFSPDQTYWYLSNTIRNLKTRYRVSLIPLGPKILSSLFVLVALEFLGEVTLWRVVKNSSASNAVEDDHLVGYNIDSDKLQKSSSLFLQMMGS